MFRKTFGKTASSSDVKVDRRVKCPQYRSLILFFSIFFRLFFNFIFPSFFSTYFFLPIIFYFLFPFPAALSSHP
jgi:hypothetical protein